MQLELDHQNYEKWYVLRYIIEPDIQPTTAVIYKSTGKVVQLQHNK
jgi:hypothetical protein